jgi:hypothetical protein
MARKAKRRPFFRPRPQQRTEDAAQKRRDIETAARSLMNGRSPEQLRGELSDRELLLAEADRLAQLDPSPENLSRYRYAQNQLEAARAAVSMLDTRPDEGQ